MCLSLFLSFHLSLSVYSIRLSFSLYHFSSFSFSLCRTFSLSTAQISFSPSIVLSFNHPPVTMLLFLSVPHVHLPLSVRSTRIFLSFYHFIFQLPTSTSVSLYFTHTFLSVILSSSLFLSSLWFCYWCGAAASFVTSTHARFSLSLSLSFPPSLSFAFTLCVCVSRLSFRVNVNGARRVIHRSNTYSCPRLVHPPEIATKTGPLLSCLGVCGSER